MPKSLNSLKSWEDVQKAYSLDQILSMAKHYEQQKAYHKAYNASRNEMIRKYKEEHPEG